MERVTHYKAVYAYNESFLGVGRTDEEAIENTKSLLSHREIENMKVLKEPEKDGDFTIVTITSAAKLYLDKWGGDPDLVKLDDRIYYSPEEIEEENDW